MDKLATGVWQRNAPGETICGDQYLILQENQTLTIAVIDGLGHGAAAAEAAQRAVKVLESYRGSLTQMIPLIHQQLLGTRGAVLSIAHINSESRIIKYVGIGNIATYMVYPDHVRMLPTNEGFLGYRLPFFREYDLEVDEAKQLIMVSDGIAAIPEKELVKISWQNAVAMALAIGEKWGRNRDDETVLVVRIKENSGL